MNLTTALLQPTGSIGNLQYENMANVYLECSEHSDL